MSGPEDVRFSIVTVCRNAATTIERTLRSVMEQSHGNHEHIVIDGGSIDGTLAILDRWRPRLAACSSGPDHGIYDAMNKGLRLARGDLVCMLNADDWLAGPDVLAEVSAAFARESSRGTRIAIYGDFIMWLPWARMCAIRRADASTVQGMRLNHQALFVHRDAYAATGDYALDCGLSADFDMVHRLHRAQVRFVRAARPLAVFAKGGSGDRHAWRFLRDTLRVQRRHSGVLACVPVLLHGVRSAAGRATLRLLSALGWRRAERGFLRWTLGATDESSWLPAWCDGSKRCA